jgi:hypothetical protein
MIYAVNITIIDEDRDKLDMVELFENEELAKEFVSIVRGSTNSSDAIKEFYGYDDILFVNVGDPVEAEIHTKESTDEFYKKYVRR